MSKPAQRVMLLPRNNSDVLTFSLVRSKIVSRSKRMIMFLIFTNSFKHSFGVRKDQIIGWSKTEGYIELEMENGSSFRIKIDLTSLKKNRDGFSAFGQEVIHNLIHSTDTATFPAPWGTTCEFYSTFDSFSAGMQDRTADLVEIMDSRREDSQGQ